VYKKESLKAKTMRVLKKVKLLERKKKKALKKLKKLQLALAQKDMEESRIYVQIS
jgi:hypothetical protein